MTRAALVALALAASACVATNRPEGAACAAPSIELALTVSATAMSPDDPAVCRGQQVTLRISPAVDGVLHIHGYDEDVPATALRADEELVLAFDATRSGQFAVELHTDGEAEGASIGVFTVHEP